MQRKIYERIHEDSLSFNRQLEASRSVQRRLITLKANVDNLRTEFDDPEVSNHLYCAHQWQKSDRLYSKVSYPRSSIP
jgi:hypothetical protein